MMAHTLPSLGQLESLWDQKYGPRDTKAGLLALRRRMGYFLPADVHEALVATLVRDGDRWLDVGGGHSIFPHNAPTARALVARCSKVVAVDPSQNVLKNTFVHESVQSTVEDYHPSEAFDLVTTRMVVEHVSDPPSFTRALARLVKPGGLVVVFTVGLWSPVTILSRAMPFKFHHALKRRFWEGEEDDTFPTYYRMNTRAALEQHFQTAGFQEDLFVRADDLSVFSHFRGLGHAELLVWRGLKAVGLPYPERNVLAVYRKKEVSG